MKEALRNLVRACPKSTWVAYPVLFLYFAKCSAINVITNVCRQFSLSVWVYSIHIMILV